MLTSGHLLAERYRLGRRLAVGGMGEVWDAVDIRLDRTVAVKVLKPELSGDVEFLHRFRTEARTTASLNHPGIASVHDYGETAAVPDGPEDTAYLVMELVEGEPLAAILARNGRISADDTLDMLEQAGRALQAAHERGLVHRDVKPGNILVSPNGKVKLTDFGIAKAANAAPVTRSGMVMGTAHYIAPEQALGGEATTASDVYSLAVVGYECLMGHRPFLSDNAVTVAMMHIREVPPPLPPDVPPGARALIEATLVKNPQRRYATGGEFAAAVASVRTGRPLPPPATLGRAPQPRSAGALGSGVRPRPVIPNPAVVGGPATGPINTNAPSGAVYLPGTPTPQPPVGRPGKSARLGILVLIGVVVLLVLIIVGLLAGWFAFLQASPSPAPWIGRQSDEVALISLDSRRQVGQTALSRPLVTGARSNLQPVRLSVRNTHCAVADTLRPPRVPAQIGSAGAGLGLLTSDKRLPAMSTTHRNDVGEPRKGPLPWNNGWHGSGSA